MNIAVPEVFARHRLLLMYKGDISALTMFAQQAAGSVCFPQSLPPLSSALDEDATVEESKVVIHPATLVSAINRMLGFDNDLLYVEAGYQEYVDTPRGIVTVYMARFKLLDPPHRLMQPLGCHMRTLPELRGRPPAEMELLRRAYTKMMEG
ncbi:hypothetical protein [Methylomonas albis]|uniref:Uncharacterized protein n=1 Tax=Methylomonas albis TaxID=1854563 RepID=A0ABR9CW63_9GAMM|nr:hypothetical protein [Methylomonas albis]MBD9355108.1 hypothetical protein [Methylomonas albis]CAD6878035.1 hypothetical protein [Methylomonas albis]